MKIVVLEKIDMTDKQVARLENIGNVEWYENSNEKECIKRIKEADVVLVDWIDPSSFILSMKTPSLLALMSTGFDWIKSRSEARKRGILISNIPGYATEAVAEHIIGLILCVARQTMIGDRNIRAGKKEKGYLKGLELKNRQIGIIGLGRIGKRVAEISQVLGMKVVTYNRNPKSYSNVEDVKLDLLLSSSDVICISCPQNEDSIGMLNKKRLEILKSDAILVGTTWNIIVLDDLISILKKGQIFGVGFDVAIESSSIELPEELLKLENVVLTPHIGFNTEEAKIRQIDICLSNIEAYKKSKPINIVN